MIVNRFERNSLIRAASILFLCALCSLQVCADGINRCDAEAGHPSDPDKSGPGIDSSQVVTHIAIPACREAVESDPANARFHYQLGRALYYWASANGADTAEAVEQLEQAAEMDYTQAMFVLGLIYKRSGNGCAAESLTRRAADKGLKSARISYVNDVLAGTYTHCPLDDEGRASKAQMAAYLEAAKPQVSGYYENMLLDNLQRQLDSLNRE
jgi:hypothetical protein